MESGRTTGQMAHSAGDATGIMERGTGSVKSMVETAHPGGKATISMGIYTGSGKATTWTAHSGGEVTTSMERGTGSGKIIGKMEYFTIGNTISLSNDEINQSI